MGELIRDPITGDPVMRRETGDPLNIRLGRSVHLPERGRDTLDPACANQGRPVSSPDRETTIMHATCGRCLYPFGVRVMTS